MESYNSKRYKCRIVILKETPKTITVGWLHDVIRDKIDTKKRFSKEGFNKLINEFGFQKEGEILEDSLGRRIQIVDEMKTM